MPGPGREIPVVGVADLERLMRDGVQRGPVTGDGVHEIAVAALMVMRGLTRGDKLKVLRKMRRLLDA